MKYSIRLDKEYFHFCAAHFMITSIDEKEPLHGHNYYVSVELSGEEPGDGSILDIQLLKKHIRQICDELDHQLLLPNQNPHLKIEHHQSQLRVTHGDTRYVFPANEVKLLPIDNVSMENLATLIIHGIKGRCAFLLKGIQRLRVSVSESHGQRVQVEEEVSRTRSWLRAPGRRIKTGPKEIYSD